MVMELQLDIETWDVEHFHSQGTIKLSYLIEQLLEQLHMEIKKNGDVGPIEDDDE